MIAPAFAHNPARTGERDAKSDTVPRRCERELLDDVARIQDSAFDRTRLEQSDITTVDRAPRPIVHCDVTLDRETQRKSMSMKRRPGHDRGPLEALIARKHEAQPLRGIALHVTEPSCS